MRDEAGRVSIKRMFDEIGEILRGNQEGKTLDPRLYAKHRRGRRSYAILRKRIGFITIKRYRVKWRRYMQKV